MKLNITVEEVKLICNLTDLKKTDILASKFPLIEALMEEITQPKAFKRASREDSEGRSHSDGNHVAKTQTERTASTSSTSTTSVITSSFKHAFAYFVYAECIDFLNTNTSGSGIIHSTGFGDSRVELLSGYEADKRQRKLELKAYTILLKYLNKKGLKRYNELKLWDDLQRAENDQAKQKILSEGRKCKIAII